MKTIVHFFKIVGVLLGSTAGIAGVIFPFTKESGIQGYLTVLGWCCVVITALGAIFVYAAQGSRRGADEVDMAGQISSDVAREMRKEAMRGADLGLELFYAGLICTVLVFYIRSSI